MEHTSHHGPAKPDQHLQASLGYETRDVALGTLSKWLVGLFVFLILASFAGLGFYKLFVPTFAETEYIAPLEHLRTYPPNPQIQARPKRDIIEYRAAEEKLEKSYTKGENGKINLPIDRAIDLLAERGISGVKDSAPVVSGSVSSSPTTETMPGTTGQAPPGPGSTPAGRE